MLQLNLETKTGQPVKRDSRNSLVANATATFTDPQTAKQAVPLRVQPAHKGWFRVPPE